MKTKEYISKDRVTAFSVIRFSARTAIAKKVGLSESQARQILRANVPVSTDAAKAVVREAEAYLLAPEAYMRKAERLMSK